MRCVIGRMSLCLVYVQVEDTIKLAQLIENCGVAAIAVHGRTRDERPSNPNHNDVIAAVAQAVNIPVIAK